MKSKYSKRVIIAVMTLSVINLMQAQIVLREPLSPRITGYSLDVKLDDKSGIIAGTIDAFWVNTSPSPVSEARLHMYMNAFRSNRSTYNGITGAPPSRLKSDYGWIDILDLADAEGNDLASGMEFISPDDGNEYDKTVLRVSLAVPVDPGDTLKLSGRFETKLPASISRTGFKKDFFFVAQWFPKFGVFEQSRSSGEWAWNCHQFHRTSEFYANHSAYDVTITLPEKYVVGTGGIILSEELMPEGLKRQTWRAEDIVDFAWTAWPRYEVYHDRWNHVSITLLIAPGRKQQVKRHLGAVKNTLEYLTQRVGPYPWPHVTVVDPPAAGQGAGGMEYTTLFTSSGIGFMPRAFR
ncbi:MAG: M1 family metallopeptidase, partial [Bacteroidetes bacterium]|nr:M1 family metallopeptidase [Bacteroidota bacterium]